MMLEEFITKRLNDEFSLDITDNEVIVKFDEFNDGEKHIAINIKDTDEAIILTSLLAGRIIKLVGNYVGNNTHVIAVNIESLII